jgi:hypothetical protein
MPTAWRTAWGIFINTSTALSFTSICAAVLYGILPTKPYAGKGRAVMNGFMAMIS